MTKIFVVLILTAILAGCANHFPAPNGSLPTESATAVLPEIISDNDTDDGFVMFLEFLSPGILDGTTERQAISTAKSLCTFLRGGGTAEEMIFVLSDLGFSDQYVVTFAGASVGAYCPEQTDKFG